MNSSLRPFPVSAPAARLPRRAFVRSLAAAPALLALRARAGDAPPPRGQPGSHGPVGRTVSAAEELKELRDPGPGLRRLAL